MNKLLIGALATLFAVLVSAQTHAQNKKVLVLGEVESQTLKSLTSKRQAVSGRTVASKALRGAKGDDDAARKADAVAALKIELTGVDLVSANLNAMSAKENEENGLVMRAASESGIPIVLENAKSASMEKLVGVGVEADLVVIESASGGASRRITLFGGKPPTIEDSETETVSRERTKDDIPEGKKEPTKEELKQWQITNDVKPAGKSRIEAAPDQSMAVERIIEEKPFTRGAKKQSLLTNACPPNQSACREDIFYTSPYVFYPNNYSPSHFLQPIFSTGRYRLANGETTVVVRFTGDIGTNLAWNASSNRGYFLESYMLAVNTTLPPGWRVDRKMPDNSNSTANLASTTGWSVSATAGVDMTGPSASVSAGYSETETFSQDITDFTVSRTSPNGPSSVRWDYRMSKSSGAAYNSWVDLVSYNFGSASLHGLPRIASGGTDLLAEIAMTGPRGNNNCSTSVGVSAWTTATVRRTWIVDTFWNLNYYTNSANAAKNQNMSFCTNWW